MGLTYTGMFFFPVVIFSTFLLGISNCGKIRLIMQIGLKSQILVGMDLARRCRVVNLAAVKSKHLPSL